MTMKSIDLATPSGAIFSDDGLHRFSLWRVWSRIRPMLLFIGLNPSSANSIDNDPTIVRLMRRADAEGFGGLLAGNLMSYVATNPLTLKWDQDVLPETDYYLRTMAEKASRHLIGWGTFPAPDERIKLVISMLREPYCLGITKAGRPKHPLYISYKVKMEPYRHGTG